MQYRTANLSSRTQIPARLSDLLSLLLGAITSALFIAWQRQMVFRIDIELGLSILFLLPINVLVYSVGILFSALWQRVMHKPAYNAQPGPDRLHAVTTLQIWAWFLLIVSLLNIVWVLLPVAWSGLRCIDNSCTSVVTLPLHSSNLIPYEVRNGLTIILWLLVYGVAFPLGSSLTFRLCMAPRWLDRKTTLYWIGCGILLNVALITTLPLVDRLGTWYE